MWGGMGRCNGHRQQSTKFQPGPSVRRAAIIPGQGAVRVRARGEGEGEREGEGKGEVGKGGQKFMLKLIVITTKRTSSVDPLR